MKAPTPINAPELPLKACSVDEHCEALIRFKRLSFWWYQGTSRVFGNFSIPFRDANDNWWYQVKAGFCWPVETYKPIKPVEACPAYTKSFFGYQHLVSDDSDANGRLVINTNFDLKKYGPGVLKKSRRKNIRRGLENCLLTMITELDNETLDGCILAWNDLTARTGWKKPVSKKVFDRTWRLLFECPGVSIILARERTSGQVAGFFTTKVIGDTACGDTIAVRNGMLHARVNDALRYTFLTNAARIPGVTKACCSIKSNDAELEHFKVSLGYEPISFPVNTQLRPGLLLGVKVFLPDYYNRLRGQY